MGQLTTQRTPTCDRLKVSEFVVQPSDEVGKAIGTEIIRDSVRCQNGDVNLGAFEAARSPDTTTAKGLSLVGKPGSSRVLHPLDDSLNSNGHHAVAKRSQIGPPAGMSQRKQASCGTVSAVERCDLFKPERLDPADEVIY